MHITIDGSAYEAKEGITLYELANETCSDRDHRPALALVNGSLRELFHYVGEGDEISFLDMTSDSGFSAMRRTYSMMFLAAVHKYFGEDTPETIVHFACGSGFYFTIGGPENITDESVDGISRIMKEMADEAIPIRKRSFRTIEARRFFAKNGMPDKDRLFKTRISSNVNVYSLGDYSDYYYGFMLHDTGGLYHFRLCPYKDGIVLQLPLVSDLDTVPEFDPQDKLFNAQHMGEVFAEKMGIGTVADLNQKILAGEAMHSVLVSEALQEAKISDIADEIADRQTVRFVMIAGPSSSGKTTFAQRVGIQLSARGYNPYTISVDNYFIDREKMKPGPDGKLDFEALSAVDVEKFNEDMSALLRGETIDVPQFDFYEGKRIYNGEKLSLGEGDILIIEGIHCLNDEMSSSLPAESKFRIYISALSQLNVDAHNRVPSGDGRLIRRIVRDNRSRGYGASYTIMLWNSVRAGERKNIFPYQENADVFFNSALPYEIAALKNYVMPLLLAIEDDDPAYFEARRLLKFLDYFVPLDPTLIPINSLVREFIGGGCFRL